jgi:lysophospholipase L1-like esterase
MAETRDAQQTDIRLRTKLLVVAISAIVALGLSEVAARIMFDAPPDPLRQPQLMYEFNPDMGFIHVPNEKGYLDDGFATINALGLRGPLPEMPKPKGMVRILAIGDSTTFGWGVNDDGTYPAQLAGDLNRAFPDRQIDIVNGGVGAYDLKHEVRLLRHFAPILQPDIVLVGPYWNDLPFEKITPEGQPIPGAGSEMPAGPSGGGPSKPFRIGNNPSKLNQILRQSRLLYIMRRVYLATIAPTKEASNTVRWEMAVLNGEHTQAIDNAWQDVAGSLNEIADMGKSDGFSVGMLIIPVRAQVENSYPHAEYQDRLRSIAASLGIFVVDPLPDFLAQPPSRKEFFIPYDRIHFSAEGNKILADAAFGVLKERPEFRAVHP